MNLDRRIGCASADPDARAASRHALPLAEGSAAHRTAAAVQASPTDRLALMAHPPQGIAVGLADASIRRDRVNGRDDPPALFLEASHVLPAHRRQGFARALVVAVADRGRTRGLSGFASHAALANAEGQAPHRASRFGETGWGVLFRRPMGPPS